MAVIIELPGREGQEAAEDGLALGPANTLLVADLGTESLVQLNYLGQIVRHLKSNDPPAEPGAFVREPLKAAGWGRWRGPVV